MKYAFKIYKAKINDEILWVAESDLKGCVSQGVTQKEAIEELEANEKEWLETAHECGISIPFEQVVEESEYSGKLSLRIAKSVHEKISDLAKLDGVSINTYIGDAISERIGAEKVLTTIKDENAKQLKKMEKLLFQRTAWSSSELEINNKQKRIAFNAPYVLGKHSNNIHLTGNHNGAR